MVGDAPQRLECDVLVLGGGPAGLTAAVTAAQLGATVVVVEAGDELGGNGPLATGNLALAGTELQREHGVTDSTEAFLADIDQELARQRQHYRPAFDRAVAERVVAEGGATYDFLVGLGFRFTGLVSRPKQHTIDRLSTLADPGQFRTTLVEALHSAGGTAVTRTRARALHAESGDVGGAMLDTPAGPVVAAARAVVLSCGGYAGSPELRQRYRPDQDPRTSYPGIPTAVGDGHVMAEQVGGELVNMSMIVPIIRASARVLADSIAVNAHGRRFHDETGHHDDRLAALDAQREGRGYYLFDRRHAEQDARFIAEVPAAAQQLADLAAVAEVIGCDPSELARTVAEWNAIQAAGDPVDPAFGRVVFPEPRIGIEAAPFTLLPITRGIASTVGGARVDTDMRVLHRSGRPVCGLYAAGDMVGLLNPVTALGGMHLAHAVTTGRLAGAAAARITVGQ